MKRFCISFLIFNSVIFTLNAQVGIKSGINVSYEKFKFDNAPESVGGLNQFIGFFYEYQINPNYFIQPEVFLSERYMEMDYKEDTSKFRDQSFTTDYVLVSILLGTKKQIINDQTFIFGTVGPYIGIGIDGTYESNQKVPDHNNYYYYTKEKIKFGNDKKTDHYKRTEIGLRFGLGFEYRAFQLTTFYDCGLSNLSPNIDQKRYSHVFALSFSYRFRFKK